MQAKWKLLVTFIRNLLRINLSHSSVRNKFAVVGIACAVCVFVYWYWIGRMQTTLKVPESIGRTTENIQSYTKIYVYEKNVLSESIVPVATHVSPTTSPDSGQNSTAAAQDTPTNHSTAAPPSPSGRGSPGGTPHSETEMHTRHSSSRWRKTRLPFLDMEKRPHILVLVAWEGHRPSSELRTLLEAQRMEFAVMSVSKGLSLMAREKGCERSVGGGGVLDRLALLILVAGFREFLNVWPSLEPCKLPLLLLSLPAQQTLRHGAGHLHSFTVPSSAIIQVQLSSSYQFYYSRPGVSTYRIPGGYHWTAFSVVSDDAHMTRGGHGVDVMSDDRNNTEQNLNSNSLPNSRMTNKTIPLQFDPGGNKTSLTSSNYKILLEMTSLHSNHSPVGYRTDPAVIEDGGNLDGVRKIFVGMPIRYWLTKLILLDAVHTLCEGVSVGRVGRERWVMVDIDDVFVAPEGTRMTVEDVQALLATQSELRRMVPGFTFNLGFVGGYYDRGPQSEVEGNHELVRNAEQFWWFGHTFSHYQPHLLDEAALRETMIRNRQFAQDHSIPAFTNHYSVSPHHSGVYPIHSPLYQTWNEVWNVTMTTTEEYPHLRPDHLRRGFIYRGMRVLPRQTCRLFTKQWLFEHFRRGKLELTSIAEGGEVFLTVLNNPISIFMTHSPNYCCDRLALVLFKSLFPFISKWTQLQLSTERPLALAERYFQIFPEDRAPVWTSPCDDKRHVEIWPPHKNCTRLPSLLILGPQKSGSTALHSFLKLHPLVLSNTDTERHFEEVQFFSDDSLYLNGIEWYMDQFPYPTSIPSTPQPLLPKNVSSPSPSSVPVLFEKSATYLTHPLAPTRAHALLPRAKLIVILADPARRAYSWYQHQRAHSDSTALQHTFSEVIRASKNASSPSSSSLMSLAHHCLGPAHYHLHISRWLEHYTPEQLLLVDGDELVQRPADVMNSVQRFLKLEQIDYHTLLQYDSHKGFFCVVKEGRKRCLGKGKGRSYPPMSTADHQWLESYYSPHNARLRELLTELGRTHPGWLLEGQPH